MKAILAHPNMDFDALASMVAAKKLFPDAVFITEGKVRTNIRDFLSVHRDFYEFKNYINKSDVDTLIMVDFRSVKRMSQFAPILKNEGLKVIVYDHHEAADDDFPCAEVHYASLGANVTQLVEIIKERNIAITPQEATLFALGIYDDTGSLRFTSTTVRDVEAVAWLLANGANLSVINEFSASLLSVEQSDLLSDLLAKSEIRTVNQHDILIAVAESDIFIADLAGITMRLKDLFSVDAVFVAVRMEKRIYITARSAVKDINVRAALAVYGGRGHIMAASAMLKDLSKSVDVIAAEIFSSLEQYIEAPETVASVMNSPVKTISADRTVNEVSEYMMRYGHSGYPVTQDGKLIGMISRRDVEKCKYHGLGNVPVKGYMACHVITVTPDTTLEEARHIMSQKNVGRLPVMEEEQLVGIITRSDILEILYGKPVHSDAFDTYTKTAKGKEIVNLAAELEKALPETMMRFLKQISSLAEKESVRVFLVGGIVRDLLMGKQSMDLDIVVEGNGIAFAEKAAVMLNGELTAYPKFGTSTVTVEGVVKIDIAGARTEFYEFPAAKPTVEQSSLKQDLFRRDFTVNAMALSLNYDDFGTLIDFYGGFEDLQTHSLRILHSMSFVEDPTRIFRALRFSGRYGFTLAEQTEQIARAAIEREIPGKLSRRRIWHEVELVLKETNAYQILCSIDDIGLWKFLFPDYEFDRSLEKAFASLNEYLSFAEELKQKPDYCFIRILLVTFGMKLSDFEAFAEEVQLPGKYRDAFRLLYSVFESVDDSDVDLPLERWYRLLDLCRPEVMLASYLLASPQWQEKISNAYRFCTAHPIYTTARDIRKTEGYERGMMDLIYADLVAAKKQKKALTKEAESALIAEGIKTGKYKGDCDV